MHTHIVFNSNSPEFRVRVKVKAHGTWDVGRKLQLHLPAPAHCAFCIAAAGTIHSHMDQVASDPATHKNNTNA